MSFNPEEARTIGRIDANVVSILKSVADHEKRIRTSEATINRALGAFSLVVVVMGCLGAYAHA